LFGRAKAYGGEREPTTHRLPGWFFGKKSWFAARSGAVPAIRWYAAMLARKHGVHDGNKAFKIWGFLAFEDACSPASKVVLRPMHPNGSMRVGAGNRPLKPSRKHPL
jgi:hypothetical protein